MENLSTDNLMKLQVEQLEKEKKELNERMRIAAKRLDHVERAYRKEERPLLAKDYEIQQANDKRAHEAAQKARLEAAKLTYEHDLQTKKRLARIMDDYKAYREHVISQRGEEFAKRQEMATKKIEEEKAKRRKLILKQREEERAHRAEQERLRREREEEERRKEAGTYINRCLQTFALNLESSERIAEEERLAAEEAAALEAEEAKKREEEEKAAALRRQREEERAAAAEQARLQRQREEEAEERMRQRAAEREREKAGARTSGVFAAARAPPPEKDAWRRSSPAAPPTPTRAAASLPSEAAPGKYRPPVFGGAGSAGGGWRARAAAKEAEPVSARPISRPQSPAPRAAALPNDEPRVDDDGFQKVPAKAVWRPKRLQGRS